MSYTTEDHAKYIASRYLQEIRMSPQDSWHTYGHDQWLKGSISATESLFPSVETLSAKNEANFLVYYYHRHGVYNS